MKVLNAIRSRIRNQKGFTLIEILVVVALTGMLSTAISGVVMMTFDIISDNRAHVDAISQVQNAERWIQRDCKMAQFVRIERDPADPTDTGMLHMRWTTWDNVRIQVTYWVDPATNELLRTVNEYQHAPNTGWTLTNTADTFIAKDVVDGAPDTLFHDFDKDSDDPQERLIHLHITVGNEATTQDVRYESRDFYVDPRAVW